MKNKGLTIRYSLINAFFFMLICGSGGYGNNFLQAKGFESNVIGIMLTAVSILVLCGQTGLAPIIDRSEKLNEKKLILILLAAAAVMYSVTWVLPAGSVLLIPFVVVGFSLAMISMPFMNSIAFSFKSSGQEINYGISRGVGSLAYALGGQICGRLLAWKTASVLPMYLIVMAALTFMAVFTLKVPARVKKEETHEETKQISYGEFFSRYKKLIPILLGLVCMYFCHMLMNNYMINILEAIGGTAADQGNVITLSAIVELPPMFLFQYILQKVSVKKLMIVASIAFSIKHLLNFLAPNMMVFYAASVLQMFAYAIMATATVYFAAESVGEEDRNKGQAIFGAATTVGGLLASFCGGFLLKAAGARTTMLIGVIVTFVGAFSLITGISRLDKE